MKNILLIFLIFITKSFSQEPIIEWGANIGGSSYDSSQAMNIDNNDNLYITGGYQSNVDFDFGSGIFMLNGISQSDAYLVKYNNNGILQWGIRYAGNYSSFGFGVDFDSFGNVYSTGIFNSTVDFDPSSNVFNMSAPVSPYIYSDIYFTKLDSNGNFIFAKQISGIGVKHPTGFSVDANGNSYITGYFNCVTDFSNTISLTPTNGTSNSSIYDIFIAKYFNSDLSWVKQIGNGSILQRSESITTDVNGNIYICGQFHNVTDFDPSPSSIFTLTPHIVGSTDIFILKLDNNGNFIWAKNMGGTAPNSANALSLDSFGNLYLTGSFSGTIDFDASEANSFFTAPTGSGYNSFLLKLDSNGNFQWAKHLIGNSSGKAIKINNNGKIAITGLFNNTCDFSSGAGTAIKTTYGMSDAFIAEFNGDGTFNWVKCFGSNQNDEGMDINSDSYSNYFAFGNFSAKANTNSSIDNVSLTSNGSQDIFILKTNNSLETTNFISDFFLCFPNPSATILNLKKSSKYDNGNIYIYSITGQLLEKIEMTNIINIEHLKAGTYILKLENNSNEFINSLFIKK